MKQTQAILIGICSVAFSTAIALSGPPSIEGTPHIIDGDTLSLNNQRIRIWGIDAPEIGQPGGIEAKYVLKSFSTPPITCIQRDHDHYNRIVAKCYNAKQDDIGELMVRFGFAWDYAQYSGGAYRDAENVAITNGRGIWASPMPIPPSEWRHQHKNHR